MDGRAVRRLTLDRAAGVTWRLLIVLAGAAVFVWLLLKLRIVLLPLLIALMITTVLGPVAGALRKRGAPPALAATAALLLAFGVLAAALGIVVPSLVSDAGAVSRGVSQALDDIQAWLSSGPLGLDPGEVRRVRDDLASGGGVETIVRSGVSSGVPLVLQVFGQVVLTVFFLFFILKDGDRMWNWVLGRIRSDREGLVHVAGSRAMETLNGWVRGTAITALIDAVFIGLGFWIIGVPLVGAIAVLTFLCAFVPIVGSVFAGAVGVLVALAHGGFVMALLALGITLLVQQIEGNLPQPGIVGRRVRLHPMVTLAAVTVGGTLGGIPGAFVAVPLTAVAYAAWEEIRKAKESMTTAEGLVVPASVGEAGTEARFARTGG
jgi:predicted PurR-regulated permease PerM